MSRARVRVTIEASDGKKVSRESYVYYPDTDTVEFDIFPGRGKIETETLTEVVSRRVQHFVPLVKRIFNKPEKKNGAV